MSVSLSTFRQLANTGDKTIIETNRDKSDIRARSFGGKHFRSDNDNAARNQQAIRSFLGSIEMHVGSVQGVVAKQLLVHHLESGKPLTGRIVKTVLQAVDNATERLSEQNNLQLSRFLNAPSDQPGLRAVLDAAIPEGVTMNPRDFDLLIKDVVMWARSETSAGMLLDETKLTAYAAKLAAPLANMTPEFQAKLDKLGTLDDTFRLTPAQATEVRAIAVSVGALTEADLTALVALSRSMAEALPKAAGAANGADLLAALSAFSDLTAQLQEQGGLTSPVENLATGAVQFALSLSGMSTAQAEALLATVSGLPGAQVTQVREELTMRDYSPSQMAMMLRETNAPNVLEMGLKAALNKTEFINEGGNVDRADVERGKQDLVLYLGTRGVPPADKELLTVMRQAKMDTVENPAAALQTARTVGVDALLNVKFSDKPAMTMGAAALASVADQLAALPENKGLQRFTPDSAWRAAFNEAPPQGVTAENLAMEMGRKMQTLLNARLAALPEAQRQGPDMSEDKCQIRLALALELGLKPGPAIDRVLVPGPLLKEDFLLGTLLTRPATAAERSDRIRRMQGDVYRMGDPTSFTVNGTKILDLNNTLQTRMTEAEFADFKKGGGDNPVIKTLISTVDALAPNNPAQQNALFHLLGQGGINIFRHAGRLFSPDRGLAGLDEHTGCDVTLTKRGNDVILRYETPDSREDVKGMVEYRVTPEGVMKMRDIRIGRVADLQDV